MATVYYVDGVCGSGKTERAIIEMTKVVKSGTSVIYATLTKRLLEQTKRGLESSGVECKLIASTDVNFKDKYNELIKGLSCAVNDKDELSDFVQRYINDETERSSKSTSKAIPINVSVRLELENDARPVVYLVTTISLIRAVANMKHVGLPVYIDEGFVVTQYGTHSTMTEGEVRGIRYNIGDSDDKPNDYTEDQNSSLPTELKSLNTYQNNAMYEVTTKVNNTTLAWFARLKVSEFVQKFSDVTLLAANHTDTMQYRGIKAAGVDQRKKNWGLATKHYSKGKIEVYYIFENTEWRTSKVQHIDTLCNDTILSKFQAVIDTNHFLRVGKGSLGTELPVKSHGFNDAIGYDHLIYLHCQMPDPTYRRWLMQNLGFTNDSLRTAFYRYEAYQAALRVSLRNSRQGDERTERNVFCFGDIGTAQYFIAQLACDIDYSLTQLLPNDAKISELDVKRKPKRKLTDTEKRARNRAKATFNQLGLEFNCDTTLSKALDYIAEQRKRNKNETGNTQGRVTDDDYREAHEEAHREALEALETP